MKIIFRRGHASTWRRVDVEGKTVGRVRKTVTLDNTDVFKFRWEDSMEIKTFPTMGGLKMHIQEAIEKGKK